MGFDAGDNVGVDIRRIGRDAESAFVHMPSGAPGDLRHFSGGQRARRAAVEFHQRRKGHVIDVHVEAHANGVRGHHVIHVAALIERHLGIACARTEGAHDDRGAAAMAADQLGDAVDLGDREGHYGGAPRQAGELFRPRIQQL